MPLSLSTMLVSGTPNEQHLPTYLSSQQHNLRCCIPSGGRLPLTYLLALRYKGRYHIANPFRKAQDTTQW